MSSAPADHRGAAAATPARQQAVPQVAAEPSGSGWLGIAVRFAPVIASAVAMALVGVWGLGRDSAMGNDEVATHWAALLSLHELAHLVRHVDAVHGLYYLLMHGWAAIGSSPTTMRVPSLISMVVGAGLLAYIARRLSGSGWVALFAGLIVALTPSVSYYAQTARSYALLFACVLAATLVLLYAMSAEAGGAAQRTTHWWAGYAVLVALAGYLNAMALLVPAAHRCTALLARYG